MMHWKHHIGGEGGGEDVGGLMAQQKGVVMGCHWRPKFLPFKAYAMASKGTNLPQYTKEGRLV
eukprot:5021914-Ditylum_brightwellii.AAC.1